MKQRGPLPRIVSPDLWSGRKLGERDLAIQSACRTAMQLLDAAPERARRLAHADPVPASTRALLRRLAERSRHA